MFFVFLLIFIQISSEDEGPDALISGTKLTKAELGRKAWYFALYYRPILHTIAAKYPEKATARDIRDMSRFLNLL